MQLVIDRLWDGSPALPAERITLDLRARGGALEIGVDAPYHGDPPPPSPPGSTPGLWNFEVVELFLHAPADRYLELEFGPHGHCLALQLDGVRHVVATVEIAFVAEPPAHGRWRGRAVVPPDLLPPGLARCNAHGIHGLGAARRYLSALPAGGTRPDFHRPDVTAPLDPALLRELSLGT
ncbi:hypothetical protein SAMN02745121_00755 [Nannocystis exedens]|uniref:Uncharacterized protein n=1 Tax=Nannocystis exedens TaxID=54 RepID=A0A1I1TNL2_9BACT|nr:hypothetical protein [Nannocystis exedens]PCC66517.1 hypothetical protein NAEX_09105 [Nannocystis exedens]SFD58768.1 hypothetical protein SAMN02745121_00755 [Nannocystis exedens]